jgi:hypothetical protein
MADSPGLFTYIPPVGNNVVLVPGQIGGAATLGSALTISFALPGNVAAGNVVLVGVNVYTAGGTGTTFAAANLTKSAGTATIGIISLDASINATTTLVGCAVFRVPITGTGSLTLTFTVNTGANCRMIMGCAEYTGENATPLDAGGSGSGSGTGTTHTTGSISAVAQGVIFYCAAELASTNFTRTLSDTVVFKVDTGGSTFTGVIQYKIDNSSPNTLTDTTGADSSAWRCAYATYKTS